MRVVILWLIFSYRDGPNVVFVQSALKTNLAHLNQLEAFLWFVGNGGRPRCPEGRLGREGAGRVHPVAVWGGDADGAASLLPHAPQAVLHQHLHRKGSRRQFLFLIFLIHRELGGPTRPANKSLLNSENWTNSITQIVNWIKFNWSIPIIPMELFYLNR